MDNPFERYDLDPRDGIAAVTRRLKELAEDATDAAERERIRQAWEELTLHPTRRMKAALFAHPETRPPLGMPPPVRRRRPAPGQAVGFRDVAALPSMVVALGAAVDARDDGEDEVPPLDRDLLLLLRRLPPAL